LAERQLFVVDPRENSAGNGHLEGACTLSKSVDAGVLKVVARMAGAPVSQVGELSAPVPGRLTIL
jgi:hypothetical protein